ncbi:MAG: ABC transporter permease, partial [Vicinamibacteria bacterium]
SSRAGDSGSVAAAPWRLWTKLGWRNLGRNRRRTFITATGLGFGYFAVVFMVGWADGLKAEMIENGTGLLSGQIQIHSGDYRPERSIYDTIGGPEGTGVKTLLAAVLADPAVEAAAPRVYASGLVSSGESTTAAMLLGFDPELEPKVSRILRGLVRGRIPAAGANELLIGTEMSRGLEVGEGAEVVLVAPAADGSMGNDVFIVTGIFRSGLQETDATYALLPLDTLQRLLALEPSRIHEVAVRTRDPWAAPEAADRLERSLSPSSPGAEIEPWTRLRPEMLYYITLLDSWYWILLVIVFVIALFGVANTMLMATFERRREFAVMLALGTTPLQVVLAVVSEALALGLLSLMVGVLVTLPLMLWWQWAPPDLSFFYGEFTMFGALMRPVLRVEYDVVMSMWSGAALLLTALVAAIYPAAHASRVPPADILSGL